MKWEEMFSGRCFISDLGKEQVLDDGDKGKIVVGRYAAWAPTTGGKGHQIVEVSDNLDMLMSKYNIPQERVCILA